MQLNIANRLKNINEYYFSMKLQEIGMLNAQGKNIINLGIGSPDLPPHDDVIHTLNNFAVKSTTHSYQSYRGIPELRNAIANWYMKYYHATLDPTSEILPLIGSKEGIMHLCMSLLNQGDAVLIPNPGYPSYKIAAEISGAVCKYFLLSEDRHWEPDFEKIEQEDLSKVKMMFVNYPNMPTGANATLALFEKLIAFGKKHHILIVNDNPYSFILNDAPLSILQVNGAMETAVELNSLSKSLNMAGWRVGMLCGSASIIDAVLRFKSNMDSGMFLPVQMSAITALELEKDWYLQLNRIYQKRKEIVYQILDSLQCTYTKTQQGLFVWAKIKTGVKDGETYSDEILRNKNVFITPGFIFGTAGNDYIRISLCQSETTLQEALDRIKNKNAR